MRLFNEREQIMKEQQKTQKSYTTPNIWVYSADPNEPDFLTASGEDPNQGEWDAQPDEFIPNPPFNPFKP